MTTNLPQLAHVYQNHHLDNTRWNRYAPRDDDIIISTSYKSGTMWMQMIVLKLLHGGQEGTSLGKISPWIDSRLSPLDEVLSIVDAQQHRRFVKTHLPLDGLRYFPGPST